MFTVWEVACRRVRAHLGNRKFPGVKLDLNSEASPGREISVAPVRGGDGVHRCLVVRKALVRVRVRI